jgi:hypothetical protein
MKRTTSLTVLLVFWMAATVQVASAQSAQEKFWTQYVEACNPSSMFNSHAHFLGATNLYGPGTTFGLKGDTTNPIADATSYFPSAADSAAKLQKGADASCGATGNRNWNLSLGVPISFGKGVDAVNLSAALTNVKSITVSIATVTVDSIPVADWEDAADASDRTKHAYTDAVDGNTYLMNAAVAATGIKVVYTLNASLSAAVTANLQVKSVVTIGSSGKPAQFQLTIGPDGQSVTLTSQDRVYLIGQFLKIKRIPPKDQLTVKSVDSSGKPIMAPKVPIHVEAMPSVAP